MLGLDTILSLPLLSFFVLPSFLSNFSWTTSLNFLFFWLTWSTVVLSHDALNIELFGTLAIRIVFYIVPCLFFFVLDAGFPSVSLGIKTHGAAALPKRAASRLKFIHYLGVVLSNIASSAVLQTALDYAFTGPFNLRSTLRVSVFLPMPLSLAEDLTLAYLIRGPLTYYIHRDLLHAPRRSNAVADQLTRWHSSWQHSLTTTMPFSAAYDHPLVYLLHRFLPVYLPALLFRFHILTYFLFVLLISIEEAFAWSGYAVLPSTVLLAGIARRTEDHMMYGGGNYGPWGIMDWVHGTTLGEVDVMDDIEEEVDKRDVRGKARKAVARTGDAIKNNTVARSLSENTSAEEGAQVGPRTRRGRK